MKRGAMNSRTLLPSLLLLSVHLHERSASGFTLPASRIAVFQTRVNCPRLSIPSLLLSTPTPDDNGPAYPPHRNEDLSLWEIVSTSLSQGAAQKVQSNHPLNMIVTKKERLAMQLVTLIRVGVPSVIAGLIAYLIFPFLAITLASSFNNAGVLAVLSQDSSQFIQNFLTVAGLLFSILVGQTYYFMYQQQEAMYYALFQEVTEAKSLLEQVALVCQGRNMYPQILDSIYRYVRDDLKQLQVDPAVLLSSRPIDDPLESIMYMTSVGVPSSVYDTVRSLRQARAMRLGALQRKLPQIHMVLLWILAAIELISFPFLGAGTQTVGGYNILTIEGALFGIMTFGIFITLRVVGELWRPAGGAYNVDAALSVMVQGLEQELNMRRKGKIYKAQGKYPSPQFTGTNDIMPPDASVRGPDSTNQSKSGDLPVLQQGGINIGGIIGLVKKISHKISTKRRNAKNP